MKNYYVAKLSGGNTVFGSISSINRINRGTKQIVSEKAPSSSLEGQELFLTAKNRK